MTESNANGMSGRLLVVEDDPFSRDMIVRRLQQRGFTVTAVDRGQPALQMLRAAHATADFPDVVLLDVNLPDISGLEVVAEIRAIYKRDELPVILVTALGESADVIAGLEAGANDYVVKPVNLPVLLARVKVSLAIKRGVALLVEAERQRVMLETLVSACDQIAQPMTAITCMLGALMRDPPNDPDALRKELGQVLDWTREVGWLIHRLRSVANHRTAPYTDRLAMLDEGSLREAAPMPKSRTL